MKELTHFILHSRIRNNTKELPSLLGGEKYIKISATDFERVMDMAQASGTLEKLNEAYDKDLDIMQGKIDKLTNQVKTLMDKLAKTETFLKLKGLFDEFKESLKPKSLKRGLEEKKEIVAQIDKMKSNKGKKKDKGIAI